jgi:hypothetical protein
MKNAVPKRRGRRIDGLSVRKLIIFEIINIIRQIVNEIIIAPATG